MSDARLASQGRTAGDCLGGFGSPNRRYIQEALARADLKPVERVYDQPPCRAYAGTGVPPKQHPMGSAMGKVVCPACGSADVQAIGAETTSTMGGDTYFNFLVRCACGTHASFSDDW